MEIFNPAFLQLLIEFALLVAIIILLWRVNANLKKPSSQSSASHQDLMQELRAVMAESQAASENFLRAMEQGRLALREIALELELKEQRARAFLKTSQSFERETAFGRPPEVGPDKYQQVVEMIRKGYSEAQTAEATGFAEPEIGLIVDLYRVKKENA